MRIAALLVIALATQCHANAPAPTYWDNIKAKRSFYLDLTTITKIRFTRCETTQSPDKYLCEAEVTAPAVTFTKTEESVQLPKSKIVDGQQPQVDETK